MEQAAEEWPPVVIGEAAGAGNLLRQKLKNYLQSNCQLNPKVREELKKLKDELPVLISRFEEAEKNLGNAYDDDDDQNTGRNKGLQQEESPMRSSKGVISDIEDEVDQIMTVQYWNSAQKNMLRKRLPSTVLFNCYKLKKHLKAIRKMINKLEDDTKMDQRKYGHHASQTGHQTAATTVEGDDDGDDTEATSRKGKKVVEGGDEAQSNPADCGGVSTKEETEESASVTGRHDIQEELLQGRRAILEDLVQFLVDDTKFELKVVDGMTGVGKTFLVDKAFDEAKTRWHKQPCAAAWISYDSSVEGKGEKERANLANLYERLFFQKCTFVGLSTFALNQMTVPHLKRRIREYLSKGSFKLIVDDVPDILEAWGILSEALPKNSNGRVIFITGSIYGTQPENSPLPLISFNVEEKFKGENARVTLLSVEKLEAEDARNLFYEIALKHPQRCPASLEKVAEAIVRDCQGVPLSIVTVATELRKQGMNPSAWYTLRGNLVKKRPHLPPIRSDSGDSVLMLCYSALGFPLKYILLYCCFYPWGHDIPEKKLVRLCVAEGFVEDTENTTAEEATTACLDQLVQCKLIVRSEILGKPTTYRVKEMLRQLALRIVETEMYREFWEPGSQRHTRRLSLIGNSGNTTVDSISKNDVAFVRSCFMSQSQNLKSGQTLYSEEPEAEEVLEQSQNLRSEQSESKNLECEATTEHQEKLEPNLEPSKIKQFAFVRSCFMSQSQNLKPGQTLYSEEPEAEKVLEQSQNLRSEQSESKNLESEAIIKHQEKLEPSKIKQLFNGGKGRLMRVLDFTGPEFTEDLLDRLVGDLVHLRYLGLRGTSIKKLPESLSRLHNLESVDTRETKVSSLPSSLMRHGKLRHVHLAGSFKSKVVELRLPKNPKAPHLQTLAGAKVTEELLENLEDWTQLRKLSIGYVKDNTQFCKLCDSINKMKHLQSLTIKTHGINAFHMETVSPKSSLRTLKVGGRISLSHVAELFGSLTRLYLWDNMLDSDSESDPFKCLQGLKHLVVLCLANAYRGKQMKCCRGWFPELKKLSIQHMGELELLEIEEGGMENLENFVVGYCPKLQPTKKITKDEQSSSSGKSKTIVRNHHNLKNRKLPTCSLDNLKNRKLPTCSLDNLKNLKLPVRDLQNLRNLKLSQTIVRDLDNLKNLKLVQIANMSLDYAKGLAITLPGCPKPGYAIHPYPTDRYSPNLLLDMMETSKLSNAKLDAAVCRANYKRLCSFPYLVTGYECEAQRGNLFTYLRGHKIENVQGKNGQVLEEVEK